MVIDKNVFMFYFCYSAVQVCPKIVLEPWHLIQRQLDWPGWDNLGSNSPIEIDHITLHRRLPTPTLGRLALFSFSLSFSLSLSPFSCFPPKFLRVLMYLKWVVFDSLTLVRLTFIIFNREDKLERFVNLCIFHLKIHPSISLNQLSTTGVNINRSNSRWFCNSQSVKNIQK